MKNKVCFMHLFKTQYVSAASPIFNFKYPNKTLNTLIILQRNGALLIIFMTVAQHLPIKL